MKRQRKRERLNHAHHFYANRDTELINSPIIHFTGMPLNIRSSLLFIMQKKLSKKFCRIGETSFCSSWWRINGSWLQVIDNTLHDCAQNQADSLSSFAIFSSLRSVSSIRIDRKRNICKKVSSVRGQIVWFWNKNKMRRLCTPMFRRVEIRSTRALRRRHFVGR